MLERIQQCSSTVVKRLAVWSSCRRWVTSACLFEDDGTLLGTRQCVRIHEEMQQEHGIEKNGVLPGGQSSGKDFNCSSTGCPDYANLIRQCGNSRDLAEGQRIHAEIVRIGFTSDRLLANFLVEMYGKCGRLEDARAVFDSICFPNVFSWTMLIVAYAQNGHYKEARQVFRQMDLAGMKPDSVTFVNFLNMFASNSMLSEGKMFHDRIVKSGFDSDVILGTAIVNMYGKCGSVQDAQDMFSRMRQRDVVAWNAMVSAYSQNGHESAALELFQRMDLEGVKPDRVVFISLLEACSKLGALEEGKLMHARIMRMGFETENVLGNALLNMYGKCGSLENARALFDSMLSRSEVSWNVMIAAYLQNGYVNEALRSFTDMGLDGTKPDRVTFISLVDACTSIVASELGKVIHDRLVESRIELDLVLGNALVNLYGKCGNLQDARNVFDSMQCRDVVSWTAMLSTYAQLGHIAEAFRFFRQMDLEGVKSDGITYIGLLDACASPEALAQGRVIHARAVATGFDQDVVVGTSLVNMYGRCGSFIDAKNVFDEMGWRNEVSWNAMIRAYAQNGLAEESFKVFQEMQMEGVKTDAGPFLGLLDASGSLAQTRTIHSRIVESGLELESSVAQTLVSTYGKHGSLEDAKNVFETMIQSDACLWNALITAYTQNGHAKEGAELLYKMDLEGTELNMYTFISLLDACSSLADLEQVKKLHTRLAYEGFEADDALGNTLINSYGVCGELELARSVFDEMQGSNVISWTALILAHANNGQGREALQLLHEMHLEGIHPNRITFLSLIDACVTMAAVGQDIVRHVSIVASAFESDVILETTLLNMHGKCGNLVDARSIFDRLVCRDLVSWNAMVSACAQNGYCRDTILLFRDMDVEGVKPDRVTFVSLLDAIAGLTDLEHGKLVHTRLVDTGLISSTAVENTVISMYGKCGSVDDAKLVFQNMSCKDPLSWSAMIAAYAHGGHAKEALKLLRQMDLVGLKPNRITFLRLIDSCAIVGALAQGKLVHARVVGAGFQLDDVLGNALITMYGKCGSLERARRLFDDMPGKNVISWTTMITAYAQSGHGKEALQLFEAMDQEGILPNEVTFICIISACSHAGLLDEGIHYFASMVGNHCVTPVTDHYICMVDLLGRAGWLKEAEDLIQKMPNADLVAWKALLGACRMHGDVERAANAARKAVDLNPGDSSPYVLLSNIYVEAGKGGKETGGSDMKLKLDGLS